MYHACIHIYIIIYPGHGEKIVGMICIYIYIYIQIDIYIYIFFETWCISQSSNIFKIPATGRAMPMRGLSQCLPVSLLRPSLASCLELTGNPQEFAMENDYRNGGFSHSLVIFQRYVTNYQRVNSSISHIMLYKYIYIYRYPIIWNIYNICPKNEPNVGQYSIHGAFGYELI